MTPASLVAAAAVGLGAAACARALRPPAARLAPRVRPYAVRSRTALGHAPGATFVSPDGWGPDGAAPLRSAMTWLGRVIESRGDEHIARMLRQAGLADVTPDRFRVRQITTASALAVVAGATAATTLRAPLPALVAVVAGFVHGASRVRRQVERAIAARAGRIRLELYTVNHLLAMHIRTGAGAIQAVQRIVDRAHGAVADELRDVLTWTRRGMGESEAFRRAADVTPEPNAARTYQLLAVGVERGVDLGAALLALSDDMRDARREQVHKDAIRRRAAMLLPTIAVLAPVMLLFIAAPLPSIVLGQR
jgi:Flp pilus assembly protein TadB